MAPGRCEGCGGPLNPSRPNQRHHGRRCRNLAYRARKRQATAAAGPALVPAAPTPPPRDLDAALELALDEQRLLAYVARLAMTPGSVGLRAATWLLERRYPERWAPPMRTMPVVAPEEDSAVEARYERWLKLVPDDG